jgi:hypothetical protein
MSEITEISEEDESGISEIIVRPRTEFNRYSIGENRQVNSLSEVFTTSLSIEPVRRSPKTVNPKYVYETCKKYKIIQPVKSMKM